MREGKPQEPWLRPLPRVEKNLIGRGYLEDIHLGVVPPKLWQVFAGTLNSKDYFTLVDVEDLTFIG